MGALMQQMKWIRGGILLALVGVFQPAFAADVYLVVNPSLKISASEALSAYLGEKEFLKAVRLMPVDNAIAQADFLERAMDLNGKKYQTYWTKKTFRDGVQPPPVLHTDTEVLAFVQKTPGAIGYVRSPSDGVTVLKKY